jgi:succinate dehydrogenase hydrophobic anchor subunit
MQSEQGAELREATSEVLFVVLPLLVLTLVMVFAGKGARDIIDDPEWSFASSILMGQAIVKYVSRGVRRAKARSDWIALTVTALIVLGLVPALIVLSWVLNVQHPLPVGIVAAQIGLFVLSVIAFMWYGAIVGYKIDNVKSAIHIEDNDTTERPVLT